MSLPRPEYPRPIFARDQWINLNGPWEFAFDDGDAGLMQQWFDGRTLDGNIIVPFAYQTECSGLNDKAIHEIVWYARSFDAPLEREGHDLLLHFGAVDYETTLWVNGREVGHNRGGHVPFTFDIAPYLQKGSNRLALRVVDRQDATQPRGKQHNQGIPKGIDYWCTTGIWQTVWLEPVPTERIEALRITPHLNPDRLEVEVFLHAPGVGWGIEVEVSEGGEVVASARCDCELAGGHLTVEIPDAKRWTPDTPHLYDLTVRLGRGGSVRDTVRSYAGLRSVMLRDGRMLLNGESLYLVSVLDQGYWPDGLLTAPSDEALRADVEACKRFGFNGARKHQKIEDPRWLYWCDRLGLLVWGEMPNARAWSPQGEEALLAEWERAVRRDYNNPCIVAWVPVNESMGFPELKSHSGQYAFLERAVAHTRRLDSTRPVVDNDGWEHTDVTDILAVHDYSHTGEALRNHWRLMLKEGQLPERIWTGSRALFVHGSVYHGQPIMLTEVGGLLATPDLPKEERDRLYNVYASFESLEQFATQYEDIMRGIASLPFVAGFCYTQLTDVEQEINGLLTYDRKPKLDPERIASLHRTLFGI